MRAARIDVDLLKKQNIGVQISQKIHDLCQSQAPVDVPIHDANGTARPGKPPERGEILGNEFIFCHKIKLRVSFIQNAPLCKSKRPCSKLGKHAVPGETQIQRIINFGPRQSIRAGVAHINSFVCQFLHGNVEKNVDAAGRDEAAHLRGKVIVYSLAKDRDANIGTAELVASDFFAHLRHSIAEDDDLHRLIPPQGIHNHGNGSAGLDRKLQDLRIKDHVGIENNEIVAAKPFEREPERIDVVAQSECRVFYEVNVLMRPAMPGLHIGNDLLLLISHNNCDVIYSSHGESFDLVIQNRAFIDFDQALWALAMHGADPGALARS